jgi:inorganic pyrophosphatase
MARHVRALSDLDAVDEETKYVNVVIETARESRTKLAYDPDLGTFVVKMVLPQGMSFPFDFGFIPSTRGGDGDPLDVLVLMDEPVPPGTIVPSRLVGVIEAVQTEKDGASEKNDRLIAVAATHDLYSKVKKLADVPHVVTSQIEHFFISYNEQEGKRFEPKAGMDANVPRSSSRVAVRRTIAALTRNSAGLVEFSECSRSNPPPGGGGRSSHTGQ